MRFIKIDPKAKTVSTVDIEPTLEGLYKAIGCKTLQGIPFLDGHMLYCDDEARLFPDNEHYNTFFRGGEESVSGNLIITKTDEDGDESPCTLSEYEIRDMIVRFTEGYEKPAATVVIFDTP